MDQYAIIEKIQENKPALDKTPLQLVYFHGSAASGQSTPLSDIDFALVVDPKITSKIYLGLETEIELLFCRILGTDKAETRIMNSAPLGFKGQVLTNGILVYSRDEEFRVEFETNIRMHYFDFLPVIRQMNQAFFKQLKQESQHG